jgi:hypothetical protein
MLIIEFQDNPDNDYYIVKYKEKDEFGWNYINMDAMTLFLFIKEYGLHVITPFNQMKNTYKLKFNKL